MMCFVLINSLILNPSCAWISSGSLLAEERLPGGGGGGEGATVVVGRGRQRGVQWVGGDGWVYNRKCVGGGGGEGVPW